jgi:thiol-disulfide isomerase/thioredoxin
MKNPVLFVAAVLAMLMALPGAAAEFPYDAQRFDAAQHSGAPVAVVFHADWCPTCRAQAPVLKDLSQAPPLRELTVLVANFDTEKDLKKRLGVTRQSTIVVFKGGKETARSTGETQKADLESFLLHAIS